MEFFQLLPRYRVLSSYIGPFVGVLTYSQPHTVEKSNDQMSADATATDYCLQTDPHSNSTVHRKLSMHGELRLGGTIKEQRRIYTHANMTLRRRARRGQSQLFSK